MADLDHTNAAEEWRDIPSWPDYQASSLGNIRSFKHCRTGRVRAQATDARTGYKKLCMANTAGRKTVKVHRLVCEAFHGPSPEGKPDVAHADGTRDNNRPANLRWASKQDNAADQIAHGTFFFPPKRRPKPIQEIVAILELRAAGLSKRKIAAILGVCPKTIRRRLNRHQQEISGRAGVLS